MLIMKINIQAAAHYLLIPLKLLFAELNTPQWSLLLRGCRMLDSVRCCQFYPFYSSLPKHQAPANNSWLSTFLAPPLTKLTSSWPRHVVNVSRNYNPCPVHPLITCLLFPLSSNPSIRIVTPPLPPSPSSINDTLMTSWLLLTRQHLIV